MSSPVTIDRAETIMSGNMVGPKQLAGISAGGFDVSDIQIPIPFTPDQLDKRKNEYMLVLGVGSFKDGTPVTIRNLREIFGKDPDDGEPCFYNQDWYDLEEFIDIPMKDGWYFVRKDVFESSRAVNPDKLIESHNLPSAIQCTYAFFASRLALGVTLWENDYVWCSDHDHNGDQIYVGKYRDESGMNKNGFSIHRHLSLKKCYGCVDAFSGDI